MANILHQLEKHLMRGPGQCAVLLGIGYSTYAGYKAGTAEMPDVVRLHAETLVRLPADLMMQLERERLANG